MEKLLDDAASLGERPGHDALRAFAAELSRFAATLDFAAAAAEMTPENPRAILGRHDAGPVLALRRYGPGEVSTVHAHAWTILLGLDGSGALERWRVESGEARLVSAEATGPSPVVIDGYEPHRQRSASGTLELIVLRDYSDAAPRFEYTPDAASLRSADRINAFLLAWSGGDIDALRPLYADEAFLDLHVPRWRVQLEGREKILSFAAAEEFQPGYRIPRWSASPTPNGWACEIEPHYTHNGSPAMSQMCMRIRTDDKGLIAEQSIYCTGIWDQTTIEGLKHSGGLLRP